MEAKIYIWAQLFKARLTKPWICGNCNCYLFTVKEGFSKD